MPEIDYKAVELRTSPHLRGAPSTDVVMFNVVVALVPICMFSTVAFGLSSAALILVTTASCVLFEHLVCLLSCKPSTVNDWSAAISGMLLGLTLPPGFPLWMGAVGGFAAIVLGKALFGGLGFNIFNPALVGRAFLQAAFPVAITTWTPPFIAARFSEFIPSTLAWPFMRPASVVEYIANCGVDGFSGATPLMLMKADVTAKSFQQISLSSLFAGGVAGCSGETCALLIILGGTYLAVRKMMDWRITVAMLGTAFVVSGLFWLVDRTQYPTPLFMLFSGGLMLGAFFMATDMVTSPTTPLGVWIYGGLCGFLTVIIRLKGGLPEGVMYSILLGNALTPLINNLTQPRIFGATKVSENP